MCKVQVGNVQRRVSNFETERTRLMSHETHTGPHTVCVFLNTKQQFAEHACFERKKISIRVQVACMPDEVFSTNDQTKNFNK